MKNKNSFLKNLLEIIISVTIIVFILIKFIVMPCVVNGKSMLPTLKENERVYSFIITRNIGIKRFDICVIKTENEGKEKLLVKRVIGLPNDVIEYKNNVLYVNGVLTEEDFLADVNTQDLKIVLGNDEYYCLGDNRDISKDSRYYGPFNKEQILATNAFVLYPFSEFGVKK